MWHRRGVRVPCAGLREGVGVPVYAPLSCSEVGCSSSSNMVRECCHPVVIVSIIVVFVNVFGKWLGLNTRGVVGVATAAALAGACCYFKLSCQLSIVDRCAREKKTRQAAGPN